MRYDEPLRKGPGSVRVVEKAVGKYGNFEYIAERTGYFAAFTVG